MLKQEMLYEVQLWGCVSALLGLPAELIPQMSGAVRDDASNYSREQLACQLVFEKTLQKNPAQMQKAHRQEFFLIKSNWLFRL